MQRYICIHGHFYQPPRENPWTHKVEVELSASPYNNWNERITAECYEPNAFAKILDSKGNVAQISNNYSRMSYNFGPTLLSWLEQNAPKTYRAILKADRESKKYFSGHGSALAQTYNHMMLPLANRRDKYTQILWGIQDFEYRFKRKPEGIWFAETGVDEESLDCAAELGIRFTILSPDQARRVRPSKTSTWRQVSGGKIDPSMAYEIKLSSGRLLNLFFYDGPVSHGIAFEHLLDSGDHFVHRLTSAFSEKRTCPQLVHIATDGESYGHHHRFGEMALAYALKKIDSMADVKLTNYGQFLAIHPPTQQVKIFEDSSWSCIHGVERWQDDCGCNSGQHPNWNQAWRAPLREAFDGLRDTVNPFFDTLGRQIFKDPWAARNHYIAVLLNNTPKTQKLFLKKHAQEKNMSATNQEKAFQLMKLQCRLMLMYTSCGWFFDDPSGIETVQVMKYAARAVELAEILFKKKFEKDFLERLKEIKSNVPEMKDGANIYRKLVKNH